MARPEAGLWDYLRARKPVGVHYSRIESQETCPGFPDVHYTLKGRTGGMELKCQEFPSGEFPFAGEKKGLRRSQKLWIRDELEAGGKVILVLQYRQVIYFLEGYHAHKLDEMSIEDIKKYAVLAWDKESNDIDVPGLTSLLRS